MLKPFLAFCGLLLVSPIQSQSSKIYHDIEKLGVLASALYVAAHPDDENQRIISHLSNERKARTVYLSLTRGDGGQNLVGSELGSELGLIRTQELLAARAIDGGEQFFSRANDFGYSKTPEETLEIWENEKVLSDVVWAIRKFKPDVIINRFNHEDNRRTHGHHTASAMLSFEAFDLAGRTDQFNDQLKYVEPWQPSRLYFNTSWWFYGSREKFAEADKSKMAEVDIGSYFPSLGNSNNEIAAEARSMHKCQGFGAELQRGSYTEYLQLLKGDLPSDKNDIFNGIETSWKRVPNGDGINAMIDRILDDFKINDPSASIPALIELYKRIESTGDDHWKKVKLHDLEQIIMDCMGLFVRASTDRNRLYPGQDFKWELEIINRSSANVIVDSIEVSGMSGYADSTYVLPYNQQITKEFNGSVDPNLEITNPYWLNERSSLGMYFVEDRERIGDPESNSGIELAIHLMVEGKPYMLRTPLVCEKIDPVHGELVSPVLISSKASLKIEQAITIFKPGETKDISVAISSLGSLEGQLVLTMPEGWSVSPDTLQLMLGVNDLQRHRLSVTAPLQANSGTIGAKLISDDGVFTYEDRQIDYDHIPNQQIRLPSTGKVLCTEITFPSARIAYIEGAGDKVPQSLSQVGYRVDVLDPAELSKDKLSPYDVVIVGIRAFNTVPQLQNQNEVLFEHAENGGTVIVQYNTRHRLVTPKLAPYHIQLSRLRVTNENSPVNFVIPDHRALNYPNKMEASDFEGWVQERGLYFADEWDEPFEAPLSMNDPGEEPLTGSLLVAKHGRGHYVYTSISWFRQLPAGVEGAYKLFANLLALDSSIEP